MLEGGLALLAPLLGLLRGLLRGRFATNRGLLAQFLAELLRFLGRPRGCGLALGGGFTAEFLTLLGRLRLDLRGLLTGPAARLGQLLLRRDARQHRLSLLTDAGDPTLSSIGNLLAGCFRVVTHLRPVPLLTRS